MKLFTNSLCVAMIIFACQAMAGSLSWDHPDKTEYCLGETPGDTATATGYEGGAVDYTHSWQGDPACLDSGTYTITATERYSGDNIDKTVHVNTITAVTHDHDAVPT